MHRSLPALVLRAERRRRLRGVCDIGTIFRHLQWEIRICSRRVAPNTAKSIALSDRGVGAREHLVEQPDLIRKLRRRYTIVMIEHDMRFLFDLADTISVIHWGQVIAEGTPETLQANKWVQRSALGELA